MIAPGRVWIEPDGMVALMCSAYAQLGVPAGPAASSSPSEIMCWAPWAPSSPGWNISRTRPDNSSRRSVSTRAAEASIATWVSWPHACIEPSILDAKLSPVCSVSGLTRVHVAAQQHGGSRTLALQHRYHRAARLALVHGQRQAGQFVQYCGARHRQPQAQLGVLVQPSTQCHGAWLHRVR